MVKHSALSQNLRAPSGATSAQPVSLRDARKQFVRQITIPLASPSFGIKKEQRKLADEHLECSAGDQSTSGSCATRTELMSSEPATVLGSRVMQLKLHRLSLESGSEVRPKPGRLYVIQLPTRQTSETLGDRQLKSKTDGVSSKESSSSVKKSSCPKKQQTQRGIRSTFPRHHGRHPVDSDIRVQSNPALPPHPRQEMCLPQRGHGGLIVHAKYDTDIHSVPVTAEDDPTAFPKHGEATGDNSFTTKRADTQMCDAFLQKPAQRRNQPHLKKNRHAYPASRCWLSPEVLETSTAQDNSSYANSAQTEIMEHVTGGHADCRSKTVHKNGSQATEFGQENEFAAPPEDVNSSGPANQAAKVSTAPRKTEVMAVIYPCEASSAHLSDGSCPPATRQTKTSQVAKERFHEKLMEEPCDSTSFADEPVVEELQGVLSSPATSQSAPPKRPPGRPKKRQYFFVTRTDGRAQGNITSVAEVTSPDCSDETRHELRDTATRQRKALQEAKEHCFHEKLKEVPCDREVSSASADEHVVGEFQGTLSSPSTQSAPPKRPRGRPKKKRYFFVTRTGARTKSDFTSVTEITSPDCSHEQVLPQEWITPQTIPQQISEETEEGVFLGEAKQMKNDSTSQCATESVIENGRTIPCSTCAPVTGTPKRKPGRPKKKLGGNFSILRQLLQEAKEGTSVVEARQMENDSSSQSAQSIMEIDHTAPCFTSTGECGSPEGKPGRPTKKLCRAVGHQQSAPQVEEGTFVTEAKQMNNNVCSHSATESANDNDLTVPCFTYAAVTGLVKRKPGRPKKKPTGAAAISHQISQRAKEGTSVVEENLMKYDPSSHCPTETVTENGRAVPSFTSAAATGSLKRKPERPKKRRRGADSIPNDLAPSAKRAFIDSNRDQVVPEQPDVPRKARQQQFLQVRLPPLAVALGRELSSRDRREGGCPTRTTQSPSGHQAPPAELQDAQDLAPKSTIEEDTLDQVRSTFSRINLCHCCLSF